MSERTDIQPSLEQLKAKAFQIEVAYQRVQQTSQNLGTDAGRKSIRLDGTSGLDKILRTGRIGEIRSVIETKTKPALLAHLDRVREEVKNLRVSEIQASLRKIQELASQGYLTPAEVQAAEAEANKLLERANSTTEWNGIVGRPKSNTTSIRKRC